MTEIAVIGCGPAGLAFAIAVAVSDVRVTLFERFNKPSIVGSGIVLQPTGLAAASVLDIRQQIETCGNRIDRILGHTENQERLVIDVDYGLLGTDIFAVSMHRSTLFALLLDRFEDTGANLVTGTEICEYRRRGDGLIELHSANDAWHGPFDLVVDASGANSAVRRQAIGTEKSESLKYGSLWATLELPPNSFPKNTLLQRFAAHNESIGVLPLGCKSPGDADQIAFFWNIECARYPDWLAAGLGPWKNRVCSIWPECQALMGQITDAAQLTLAKYRHHTITTEGKQGLVFIGDAAHATSPQLGQGVNMGLLDAVALADAISETANLVTAVRNYSRRRKIQVQIVQQLARFLIPFYQADNAVAIRLRDFCFEPIAGIPLVRYGIAKTVSGLLIDSQRPRA